MLKNLIILFYIIYININSSYAIGINIDTNNSYSGGTQIEQKNNIFGNIGLLNSKKSELRQAESVIEVDKKTIEEKNIIISDLNKYYLESYKLLENIENTNGESIGNKEQLKKDFIGKYQLVLDILKEKVEPNFEAYKNNILDPNRQNKIKIFIEDLQAGIIKLEKEIKDNENIITVNTEEIIKIEAILEDNLSQLLYKVIIFISIIIFLIILKKIINNYINKSNNFTEERKIILSSINKGIINTALGLSIFVFFSSEFFAILPFLAIIGTALGFALRDILSSFIAWFVIGLRDHSYKVGDIIEIKEDKIFGKVTKIKLITTTVLELGLSGPTGQTLTFPNKKIFEKSINNISKMKGFTYIAVDFLIDINSDLDISRKILKDVMDEIFIGELGANIKNKKSFAKKYNLAEDTIEPQVFLNIQPRGIMLRGKIMTIFIHRHKIRNMIIENFIKQAANHKEIKLKMIEAL